MNRIDVAGPSVVYSQYPLSPFVALCALCRPFIFYYFSLLRHHLFLSIITPLLPSLRLIHTLTHTDTHNMVRGLAINATCRHPIKRNPPPIDHHLCSKRCFCWLCHPMRDCSQPRPEKALMPPLEDASVHRPIAQGRILS